MMREERAPETASTCPACKSKVKEGDRFCELCGEKIPPQSSPAQAPVCRSCGTPLLPNARFCENCGDPVKKAEVPAAPSTPASAKPVSQEPVLPRGLIVTEEPVAVAGPVIMEESVPFTSPAVRAVDGAAPARDERPVPESVEEGASWEEPEDRFTEEPVQEPETESEDEFDEEPAEEPEDEFAEEPAEAVLEGAEEELPDEPEQGPGRVTEEPGPALPIREPRTGPVDELLLGLEPEEPTGSTPGKRPVSDATKIPKKPVAATAKAPRNPGSSKKIPLIIGFIAVIIVIAIALVILLPMLTGSGSPGTKAPVVQATPVVTVTPVITTVPALSPAPVVPETSAPTPAVPAATLAAAETTEQVDILPPQYTLHFEVFKDVVTGDVTVTATGPSRNVVKDIEVTVFHPDGTTDTDHLLPPQGMTEVTVTGTRSSERVVVTVLFYSGEQYKLIDRTVSFSRRT